MKTKLLITIVFYVGLMFSCDKTDNIVKQEDESLKCFLSVNEKYKKIQSYMGALHSTSSFKKAGMKASKMKNKASFKCDTVNWDDWESCATITESIDDNGNFIIVMDYGVDGCEEYGTLIKGKITTTWGENDNAWYFEETYENFYMYETTTNGTVVYESTWEEGSGDFFDWGNFSSSSTEDITITFDDGETIHYESTYKEESTNDSYTVTEGHFSGTSSLGYSFVYDVTNPLVYSFACEMSVFTPVQGTEFVSYTENGETEEFVVDYGDGTCDNKFTITVDGVTTEYDYDDWWDDDNWGDESDSTNVYGN